MGNEITTNDIRNLRDEAWEHGDYAQCGYCTLALEGKLEGRGAIPVEAWRELRGMTQAQALAECQRVIDHARAQSNDTQDEARRLKES